MKSAVELWAKRTSGDDSGPARVEPGSSLSGDDKLFPDHPVSSVAWHGLITAVEHFLQHPRTSPTRHAVFYRMVARNRVWLARRHLPSVLVPIYLGIWAALTLARRPSAAGLRAWVGGFAEGWRTPCPPRHPMRWRTVWKMTRLGRPPIV